MVHGACSSSGCYSMTDEQMEQIYAFARDAFRGGQTEFQIQSFPFRMTAANMARYRKDANYPFWEMLKEGYDQFEITKVPPKVDVCEKRYVFNRVPEGTATFSPTAACPPSTQPDTLATAYQSYQKNYDAAFALAAKKGDKLPPRPSIAGLNEANIVSAWTKKRAKGERIPIEPPSMNADGTVTQTARMGRIDSPAGKEQAALEAATAEKAKAAAEKKAIALAKAEEKQSAAEQAKAAAEQPVVATGTAVQEAGPMEAAAPQPEKPSLFSSARKRIVNIFGS
jgi:hypothetical protein